MDDAAIMLELSAGNMAGFDYLIQKYRKPIVHFMYRMVHNQAVAEELCPGGLSPGLPLARDLPCRGSFQHLALPHRHESWSQSRPRYPPRARSLYYLLWMRSIPRPERRPTSPIRHRAQRATCSAANDSSPFEQHVLTLPERQRMAVLMHKYQGMDYKQIGDVLKLSESATKSLLFRAYQTLRGKLKSFI